MCEQGGALGHVSIDGAAAWNGVRKQVELIYGDTDEVSLIARNIFFSCPVFRAIFLSEVPKTLKQGFENE